MSRDHEAGLLTVALVGLALTSCVLALQGVVTFPLAVFIGIGGTFALLPPQGGRFPRHYVALGMLGLVSAVSTFLLHRAGW